MDGRGERSDESALPCCARQDRLLVNSISKGSDASELLELEAES